MATYDRIVLDGFRYTVEDHIIHAEGKRPAPCKRLTFTDEPRQLQIEIWFTPGAYEEFVRQVQGGKVVVEEPTRRLGV